MRGRSFILAALAVLSGCATAAQRQAETIGSTIKASQQQAMACFTPINTDPAYEDITRHIPLGDLSKITLSQLMDRSYVTPHEIELLSSRHDRLVPCREALIAGYMVAPPMAAVLRQTYSKGDELTLQLAQKQLQWGEFVARQKALADDNQSRISAAAQGVRAQLDYQHRQEMADRAVAAEAFSAAMARQQQLNQNQQLINLQQQQIWNANRPVNTNCTHMGMMTNCTSY